MPYNNQFILSRNVDILFTGLLSIVVISIVLLFDTEQLKQIRLEELIIIGTLINGAHFMASYRMLYSNKEYMLRYKSASIYAPLLIFSFALFSIALGDKLPIFANTMLLIAGLYLSLHYTGQAWGMIATLAYVDDIKFSLNEKTLLRLSLRLLMCWQVLWLLLKLDTNFEIIKNNYLYLKNIQTLVMLSAILLGGVALLSFYKTNILKKLRVSTPYFAIYLWYALLYKTPLALPLVQFFHAIQYIIYPIRVEINRTKLINSSSTFLKREILKYITILLILSLLIFILTPAYFEAYDSIAVNTFKILIAGINIHHFYIDSCIWRVSNPVVKNELFAHLKS
jgi:hypothetical protein